MKKQNTNIKGNRLFSFQNKLFLSYLIIIVFTLIAFLSVNFYQASREAEKSSVYSAGQTLGQTLQYMEYMLGSINRNMDQIAFNDQIQEIFLRETSSYSQDKLLQVSDSLRISNVIFTAMSDPVSGIQLYIPDEIGLSQEKVNYFGLNQAMKSLWYQRIKDTRKSVWLPSSLFVNEEGEKKVSLVRKIVSLQNYDRVLGIIRLEVPERVFAELLDKAKFTENSSAVLFNSYGETICESSKNAYEPHLTYGLLNRYFPEDRYAALTWKREVLEGEDYLIGVQSLGFADWKIALAVPWKEIMQPYIQTRNNMFIVVLLVIPLSFLLSFLFSSKNTKRIRLLISHMRKVVNGNFNIGILPAASDEIGELFRNYNYMITKISMLLEEKYALGHQVKNLELKSLQAQINPHFLYNTLDLINWMSKDAHAPKISELVRDLSGFYRLSLSKGEEMVSLENELQHITHYVRIQNMRFDNGIKLETDVPDSCLSCKILKLTLQPIVENSILHGILEKDDEKGTIRITAEQAGDTVVISIDDNGIGIPPEKLKTLLLDSNAGVSSGGFGVKNIHERIRLSMGEKYGLEFESVPGRGTTVRIRIPLSV